MKTFKDFEKEIAALSHKDLDDVSDLEKLFNSYLLAAVKAGERFAAEQCKPENEDYQGGSTGNARGTSNMIKQAILTDANNRTELPLK